MSNVNQFKDLEINYDATATLTVKFYTDLPGGTMTLRRTLSFASGRKRYTLPFDDSGNSYALVEGRLFKVRFECTGVARIYGGTLRFRKIGTYIDGTQGEIWETLEIAI